MKKCNEKLIFASAALAGALIGVTGCGVPAGSVYGPPPQTEEDVNDIETGLPEADEPEVEDVPDEEPEEAPEEEKEYNPGDVFTYYSDDESVSIVQDYNTGTSVIVDGDEEIPVDIAMGSYGPRIMKCDIDGDGEDEYVISECEGTGTGFSVRGLCIVEKTDDGYKLTRYDGDHFAQIIEGRVGYSYVVNKRTLTISIVNENEPLAYFSELEGEDEFERLVWTDQIGIYFEDDKVYLSSCSGIVFKEHGWPEYEQGIEIYAPITVDTDSSITVGDFSIR